MNPIYMHINYWERKGQLERAFELAKMNGYDGIELRMSGERMGFDKAEDYRNAVCRLRDKYPGFGITFVMTMNFMTPDAAVRKAEAEKGIEFFLWAEKNVGTKTFNAFTGSLSRGTPPSFEVSGSGMATPEHYAWAAEGLTDVGKAIAGKGIRLALESHNNALHDIPVPIRRLLDMVKTDNIGVNLDHGNIILNEFGGGVPESIELLKDKIFYIHLKNMIVMGKRFYCTTLADGMIDHFEYLSCLKKIGYSGIITIEYPARGDHFSAARRDIEYLRSIMDHPWLGTF
jgi:sugar phosphate isomerase/epimerase